MADTNQMIKELSEEEENRKTSFEKPLFELDYSPKPSVTSLSSSNIITEQKHKRKGEETVYYNMDIIEEHKR